MPTSRIEREAAAFAAALLTGALWTAAPAAAQLGPPVSLLPRAAPAPPPAAAPGTLAPAGATQARDQDQDDIRAVPLAPMDASWSGALGDDRNPFPQTMWRGTPRAVLAASLSLLAPTTSPTLQDLARRLLLSNAAAPGGADATDRPSLATARLDRILALGQVSDALAMMDALPADPSGDGLDRARVELHFAANDIAGACATVAERISRYRTVWWDRALIACQALGGDSAKASLGQSLLRERKAPPDAVFDALIDAVGGRTRKIDKLPDPTPMRLALLAAAKLPLPAEAFAAAGPAALMAYAGNPALPIERRLVAAERAAALGAMTPEALGELYQQVAVKPEEQVAALKDGKLPEDAKSRAALYQVARASGLPETRAAAIGALLDAAQKHDLLPLTARLVAPALAELRPEGTSPAFAAAAARALLVAGDADAARPWIDTAQSRTLVLLAQLAVPGAESEDTAALLRDALAELAGRDAAAAPARADLLLALLAAFDETVAAPSWSLLLAPPHDAVLPSAVLWVGLEQATADKRVGETVLDAVLVLAARDRLSLEPILLGRAIAGLRAIGREADARALAVEAAIDAGI